MRRRLRLNDLFDGQWPRQFVQDGCLHCIYLAEFGMRGSGLCGRAANSSDFAAKWRVPPLRLGAAQEKLDRVSHSLGEFVRSSKIHRPLPDNGIEKSFHEFGQVYDWKIKGYLPVSLAFRDDFTKEANGRGFRPS